MPGKIFNFSWRQTQSQRSVGSFPSPSTRHSSDESEHEASDQDLFDPLATPPALQANRVKRKRAPHRILSDEDESEDSPSRPALSHQRSTATKIKSFSRGSRYERSPEIDGESSYSRPSTSRQHRNSVVNGSPFQRGINAHSPLEANSCLRLSIPPTLNCSTPNIVANKVNHVHLKYISKLVAAIAILLIFV